MAITASEQSFLDGGPISRGSVPFGPAPAPGGYGFLTALPFFFQLFSTGFSIFGAIQERKRRERIVALSDERINLELKAAKFEEIEQVEQLAFVEQVQFQQAFNKDNPIGLSYTEAAISSFGNDFGRRQDLWRRMEDFKRAKRFEAQDIREGNTISSTALFTQTLSDSATGLVQGFTLQQQIRSLMQAGDFAGVQGKLFEQQLLQGDATLENSALQRTLYQKQIEEISARQRYAAGSLLSLSIGIPEKIQAGAAMPGGGRHSSPAVLGAFLAAGKQTIGGRRSGNLTTDINAFMIDQRRRLRAN